MIELIRGDCLEEMKKIPENSVDSIVTDPPYELGFMGKSWDNTGIANSKEMWREAMRVLKPGGHLLAFSGTRTYHRMACAIEDAGFEVRDMIEWVYGSGFPKSLNIGKAVDKLQGNEREVLPNPKAKQQTAAKDGIYGDYEATTHISKGTSEWEGWGTALKPAHEPICMARKPLGQQELDIAKNICYNIIEKGLITNSKIIWRINNVKIAEKQKTKQSSTQTQQQKMVVVSAEFVETKENESVGKKIQKLIENICESGMQETGNKQREQVQKVISKIEIDGQNTTKNTNEEEKKKQSLLMEENASVVENQDLSSLPLTTLEVEEDNTEKKSKTETSMSSLKSTDTQKTDIDCSAQTATSQWVCMDIVRTLKVSFEGKEYDFIELSDGSLVWNEALEPYRKQQKLNVAENVLKYGTGGINVDESRVETDELKNKKWNNGTQRVGEGGAETGGQDFHYSNGEVNGNSIGRFPANLLHDNSEEVRGCFPEQKSGKKTGKHDGFGRNGIYSKAGAVETYTWGDSGNASRFFKSIIYQAKSSKSERTSGGTITNGHPTIKPIALMEYLIKMVTPEGGTVLDPFMGSGSTGVAAKENGYSFIGIDMTAEYIVIAKKRIYDNE